MSRNGLIRIVRNCIEREPVLVTDKVIVEANELSRLRHEEFLKLKNILIRDERDRSSDLELLYADRLLFGLYFCDVHNREGADGYLEEGIVSFDLAGFHSYRLFSRNCDYAYLLRSIILKLRCGGMQYKASKHNHAARYFVQGISFGLTLLDDYSSGRADGDIFRFRSRESIVDSMGQAFSRLQDCIANNGVVLVGRLAECYEDVSRRVPLLKVPG